MGINKARREFEKKQDNALRRLAKKARRSNWMTRKTKRHNKPKRRLKTYGLEED